jgi:hypothetical protein
VTALHCEGKKLISTSKDFKVAIISIGAGGVFKLDRMIDLTKTTAVQNLPLGYAKSIDCLNGNLLLGLRNGTIIEAKDNQEPRIVVESHFEGETWGLHIFDEQHVLTSGDDNRIMLFDTAAHKFILGGKVSDRKERKDPSKKSLASTMSQLPPNKQARAITASMKHNHLVVCSNLGKVSIRSLDNFDQKVQTIKDA